MAAHRQAASSVLGLLPIRFDIGDASFEKFNRLLLESTLKSADVVLARLSGVSIKNEDVIKANELYRPKAAKRLNRLSEVAESVIQAQPLLAGKTHEEKRTIARDFDRWYRGKSLRDLTKRDCQEFADYLQAEGLMGSTIRKKIGFLKNLFDEAVDRDLIPVNLALRIKLPPKSKKKSRIPYDDHDLQLIFSSIIYTGGKRPISGRGEAGVWMPLIALFTGARLEEISQLQTEDVIYDGRDEVWVFRFLDLDDAQELKTDAARRLTPVHSELIKAGLLAYVDSQKDAGHKRLFHKLTPDKFGFLGASYSKWWRRHATVLGITDRRKVFHSFRHLVTHVLRREEIEERVCKAIIGHEGGDVHSKYGSEDYPLPPKIRAIARLTYPGLVIPKVA